MTPQKQSGELPLWQHGAVCLCQVCGYALGKPLGNDLGNLFDARGAQLRDAPEISQQFLSRAWADSGNVFQARLNGAFRAALPVKAHGEAMRFIANLLDQMKDR